MSEPDSNPQLKKISDTLDSILLEIRKLSNAQSEQPKPHFIGQHQRTEVEIPKELLGGS